MAVNLNIPNKDVSSYVPSTNTLMETIINNSIYNNNIKLLIIIFLKNMNLKEDNINRQHLFEKLHEMIINKYNDVPIISTYHWMESQYIYYCHNSNQVLFTKSYDNINDIFNNSNDIDSLKIIKEVNPHIDLLTLYEVYYKFHGNLEEVEKMLGF